MGIRRKIEEVFECRVKKCVLVIVLFFVDVSFLLINRNKVGGKVIGLFISSYGFYDFFV